MNPTSTDIVGHFSQNSQFIVESINNCTDFHQNFAIFTNNFLFSDHIFCKNPISDQNMRYLQNFAIFKKKLFGPEFFDIFCRNRQFLNHFWTKIWIICKTVFA